jgi:ribosome biogenesis GTPase
LKALGWGDSHHRHFEQLSNRIERTETLVPARVAALERGAVVVLGAGGDPRSFAVARDGRSRRDGLDAPAVGDWVALRASAGELVVEHVLPRSSYFVRKEAGRRTAAQMVAANVDRVLVVTAIGDDLSPGRIERYLAAIWAGGAEPVVVINKRDRPHDTAEVRAIVQASAPGVQVVSTSTVTDGGTDELTPLLVPGSTIALVGSSGVGKTSLLNRLLGDGQLATGAVREGDDKGRHTTTRRELHWLPSGALVIDTPGMREFGLWDAGAGLSAAFADIEELAARCRFTDCTHAHEPECAVLEALERGVLLPDRLARYHRLAREIAHVEARAGERPGREGKQRVKNIARGMRERLKINRKLGLKDW